MRVVILAEGSTEEQSLGALLRRAIEGKTKKPVGIDVVALRGAAELRKSVFERAGTFLAPKRRGRIAGVIALFDLVSPPEVFYGDASDDEVKMSITKDRLRKEVGNERFEVAFAVPETEAWLFADPNVLPANVRKHLPERLTRAPESMRDKPSDVLKDLYRRAGRKAYRKTTDGSLLFAALDPAKVYERCPRFRMLVDAIVELADRANA